MLRIATRNTPPRPGRAPASCLGHSLARRTGVRLGRDTCSSKRCAPADSVSSLQRFVLWLIANGVDGISPGSKAALCEADSGERGVVCTQPISEGEVVLRIPMRLAISDYPGDDTLDGLVYDGAHWSVRLATKLLRERAQAAASPWYPYLQALPEDVWTPLRMLTDGQMDELQYQPMLRAVRSQQALIDDAFTKLPAEALAEADYDAFTWAMSIVFSRTFGSAAEGGGVGVHMLVPLADMLNHGGDVAAGRLCDASVPVDNVRWVLVPPASGSKDWTMAVTAACAIEPGDELLMSYGERSNDDFLLHYGFVPAGNVHDDFVLFDSIDAALQWHRTGFPAKANEDATLLASAYVKARQAALEELQTGVQAGHGAAAENIGIRLFAGSRVDGAVVEAFSCLRFSRKNIPPTEDLIAARCGELLNTFDSTLLADLRLLAAAGADAFQDQSRCCQLLRFYSKALRMLAGAQQGEGDGAAHVPATSRHLAAPDLLAIAFRANKKAMLWDCLLARELL